MGYLALYRQWRPQTFSEVVGQKHISIPLQRAVEQERLVHAYLFSGPRGTGKTSMAKILAKAVNCESLVDGWNPCNACITCKEVNEGSSLDVYEIDAASNRGIEEIRALKESVQTLPSISRKKVYIIDEVHMLTKEAFNALLKTLEEPPAHVLFILATTEPEKIPITILSRCQRYEFHRISVQDIQTHLLHVAKESGLDLSPEAATLIAVRAEGGLRDALSLLDQCSGAAETKELSASLVYDLLGLTGKDELLRLTTAIFAGNTRETFELFSSLLQKGKEPLSILRDLAEHFRALMICKVNSEAPELSSYGNQKEILEKEAKELDVDYIDALFASLNETLTETKRSASPRMNAEMGLLRLCRVRGTKTLEGLERRVSLLEQERKDGHQTPLPSDEKSIAVSAIKIPPEKTIQQSSPNVILPLSKSDALQPKVVEDRKEDDLSTSEGTVVISSQEDNEILASDTYDGLWKKVLDYFLAIHRLDVSACFQKGKLIYVDSQQAVIEGQPFLVRAAANESYRRVVSDAFQNILGRPLITRTVLQGSEEGRELRKRLEASVVTAPKEASESAYQSIGQGDISEEDKNHPALRAALKMIPDCDIYEKN